VRIAEYPLTPPRLFALMQEARNAPPTLRPG